MDENFHHALYNWYNYLSMLGLKVKWWAPVVTTVLDSFSILSQVTLQVTCPRLRSQVTCGVFCLCFLKWLHQSLGPKSLGLYWNAPYCFPSDALLTSPCTSVNTTVTSHMNTIVTSLDAAPQQPTMLTMLSKHPTPNLSMKRILTSFCTYVVKHTI